WLVQTRFRRRPAVAGKAGLSGARDGGNHLCPRVDPANSVIVRIGEDQVAVRREREIERLVQQRGTRRAAITRTTLRTRAPPGADDPSCHGSHASPSGHHGCRTPPVKRKLPVTICLPEDDDGQPARPGRGQETVRKARGPCPDARSGWRE